MALEMVNIPEAISLLAIPAGSHRVSDLWLRVGTDARPPFQPRTRSENE